MPMRFQKVLKAKPPVDANIRSEAFTFSGR
jgi:hypothetical protein